MRIRSLLFGLLLFLAEAEIAIADPLEFFSTTGCVEYSLDPSYCRTVPQWYLHADPNPSQVFQNGSIVPSLTEPGGSYDLRVPAGARADGVTVGIIDSGCQPDHPDLAGAILGGCYINDRGGSVLVEGQYADFDPNGHGTGIASIVAANRNGAGMAGIAQGAKLLIVSTPLSFPDLAPGHVAKGITWLVNHGANIVVLSWGEADAPNAELLAACSYANAHNVLIFSSVGYGRNLNTSPTWPYGYNLPNYLPVSGVTRQAALFPPSSYGVRVVGAPGDRIVMATVGSGYVYDNGNSFASPMVAAVAALCKAHHPGLSAADTVRCLKWNLHVRPLSGCAGRIDARDALEQADE